MKEQLSASERAGLLKLASVASVLTAVILIIAKLIAWLITGDVSAALQIGFIEVFAKIAIYYAHERAWAQVPHGTFSKANAS